MSAVVAAQSADVLAGVSGLSGDVRLALASLRHGPGDGDTQLAPPALELDLCPPEGPQRRRNLGISVGGHALSLTDQMVAYNMWPPHVTWRRPTRYDIMGRMCDAGEGR